MREVNNMMTNRESQDLIEETLRESGFKKATITQYWNLIKNR